MPHHVDSARWTPWLQFEFSRSPGPGGQNVNKVNTQVTALFDVQACTEFTRPQKDRICRALSTRLDREGRIRVRSRRERTQARNRAAALARLETLIEQALEPRKRRVATRPSAAARRRRRKEKELRSQQKRQRNRVRFDE